MFVYNTMCVTLCMEFVFQDSGLFDDVLTFLNGLAYSAFTVKKSKTNLFDGSGLSWYTFYELMFVKDRTKWKNCTVSLIFWHYYTL